MRVDKAKVRYPSESNVEQKESNNTRPSAFTGKLRGEYYNIEVTKLQPFHKQARKHFDEEALKQLAETIKAHGIRQPLTIIPADDSLGKYEVVSGERRLRAAIIAGLDAVPCIIIHDKKAAVEIALIENVQRKDLHPIELAKAYQQFLDEGVCDNKTEIAEKLSVSKSVVTETMQLLALPDSIQTKLLEENIVSRSLFRELLEKDDTTKMVSTITKYTNVVKARKASSGNRKKIIFKVMSLEGKIIIDDSAFRKMSVEEKGEIKANILKALH
jgi:ParB family chromosome partitioning protein